MSRDEVPDLPTDSLARLDLEDLSIPELLGLILHAHGRPLDLDRRAFHDYTDAAAFPARLSESDLVFQHGAHQCRRGPGRDVDGRTRKGESR